MTKWWLTLKCSHVICDINTLVHCRKCQSFKGKRFLTAVCHHHQGPQSACRRQRSLCRKELPASCKLFPQAAVGRERVERKEGGGEGKVSAISLDGQLLHWCLIPSMLLSCKFKNLPEGREIGAGLKFCPNTQPASLPPLLAPQEPAIQRQQEDGTGDMEFHKFQKSAAVPLTTSPQTKIPCPQKRE